MSDYRPIYEVIEEMWPATASTPNEKSVVPPPEALGCLMLLSVVLLIAWFAVSIVHPWLKSLHPEYGGFVLLACMPFLMIPMFAVLAKAGRGDSAQESVRRIVSGRPSLSTQDIAELSRKACLAELHGLRVQEDAT